MNASQPQIAALYARQLAGFRDSPLHAHMLGFGWEESSNTASHAYEFETSGGLWWIGGHDDSAEFDFSLVRLAFVPLRSDSEGAFCGDEIPVLQAVPLSEAITYVQEVASGLRQEPNA